MSDAISNDSKAPEKLQFPVLVSADDIIISKNELHSLRFRVRILKKFLNRLSMRLDALAFPKSTATKTIEAR